MKIGIDHAPASPVGTYAQRLAQLLAEQAPEHEYIVDDDRYREVELYHSFGLRLPFWIRMRRVPSVVTVANLHFMHYPHLYTFVERIFVLRAYRRTLRSANRLIAFDSRVRDQLSEQLAIDRDKIEVVQSLAAQVPRQQPSPMRIDAVRRKYGLPDNFILMLGTVEPRHNHEVLLRALAATDLTAGVVICGRRTAYSEQLLTFVREHHLAARVDFIYELSPADLPALFNLAGAFVYLPDVDAEASIIPVVEAMRMGVPQILSDTPSNREVAGAAALYVHPEEATDLAAALEQLLQDADFRGQMQLRERHRAELFSEYALAQRLIDIYASI
ncbi:MAG: glycosyltransferase family 1 protein [Alistipes sp.]